jgi:hypothetical protein
MRSLATASKRKSRSLDWPLKTVGFALLLAAMMLTSSIPPTLPTSPREIQKSLSLEPAADSYSWAYGHSWGIDYAFGTLDHGELPHLEIITSLGASGWSDEETVAFFMFDLSDLPRGTNVLRAVLHVYQLGAWVGEDCCLGVQYVTDNDWTEYGPRGPILPATRWENLTTQATIRSGEVRYALDVSKDVRSSLEHERLALTEVLTFTFQALGSRSELELASREDETAAHRPTLDITYASGETLNKVSLAEAGSVLLVVTTTSTEVQASVVTPIREYLIELREGREHGWAKIVIHKAALFSNAYASPGRARSYENSTHYTLVVEYGKSDAKHSIHVISYTIATCDGAGRGKRIFHLGEEVYVKGVGFEPGRVVDIHVLPDGATLTPAESIANATVTVDAGGNIPPSIVLTVPQTTEAATGRRALGSYDLWVDANRNGIFDNYDAANDAYPESCAMIAVPEFSATTPLLLIALVFLLVYWPRARFIKRERNRST